MNVLQDWVIDLSMMQQSVLLAAVRGPDNVTKYHPAKYLLRWYRRCVLFSALDGTTLDNPYDVRGGSFTGPSIDLAPLSMSSSGNVYWPVYRDRRPEYEHVYVTDAMDEVVGNYLSMLDELPHHYQLHFMHAVEILGYKHPNPATRSWWNGTYERIVRDMHLQPESEEGLDFRLGDDREQWLATADPATRS